MVSRTQRRHSECAVPNCTEPAECGRYCYRHYNQWIYRRDKGLPAGDLSDGWPCPICGERLRQLSNHMARHHGITLSAWYREHNVLCRWPDCDRIAVSRGLCKKHSKVEWMERKERENDRIEGGLQGREGALRHQPADARDPSASQGPDREAMGEAG